MKTLILLICCLVLISGCISKPSTVCQEFPLPSYIEQYIPDLKTTNSLIKISVYEVSKLDDISKKDIVKVLDEAEAIVNRSGTWNELATYLMSQIKVIQNKYGPEIMILGDDLLPFTFIKTPVPIRDVCYVRYELNELRKKVLPWIK
jgi:hypothetical protein